MAHCYKASEMIVINTHSKELLYLIVLSKAQTCELVCPETVDGRVQHRFWSPASGPMGFFFFSLLYNSHFPVWMFTLILENSLFFSLVSNL